MIIEGVQEAIKLIVSFDSEMYNIIVVSLYISLTATIIGGVLGVVSGFVISIENFFGKQLVKRVFFTLMGVPPVVVGLLVLLILVGPLSNLDLLFTKTAMLIAQTILVYPIVTGHILLSVEPIQKKIIETTQTLGANRRQSMLMLIRECRPIIFTSFILGLSRAISEVGAVMLVGGNIRGETRVMTSYIALTNQMGQYSLSIAMAIVLLLIAFVLHSVLSLFRGNVYDYNS